MKATCFEDLRIFDEPITKIEPFVDSTAYELLKSDYNQEFHIGINLTELDPHLTEFPDRIIGRGCGIAGAMPRLGKKMLELTSQRNTEELLNWTGISSS